MKSFRSNNSPHTKEKNRVFFQFESVLVFVLQYRTGLPYTWDRRDAKETPSSGNKLKPALAEF